MLCFPNAKINIGLQVIQRNPDGYHQIETLLYPASLCDVLEIVEDNAGGGESWISVTGADTGVPASENICARAYNLMRDEFDLPPVRLHLHKIIPAGSGLGGGSSDAAGTLILLDRLFGLGLTRNKLASYAARLGSDCPFFIHNRPSLATGRGDILSPVKLDLGEYYLMIVCPGVKIDTAWAYRNIIPKKPSYSFEDVLRKPVYEWPGIAENQFEKVVFSEYPALEKIKEELFRIGAMYASISGSGSSVYGIFHNRPERTESLSRHFVWVEKMVQATPVKKGR